MTRDDFQQLRKMYDGVDELCRRVEDSSSSTASEEGLRRLVGLFHDQQREPEQIRSFLRHLGVPAEVIRRVLGKVMSAEDAEDEAGIG